MSIIRISGQTSVFFNFQPLMADEFIPIVEMDKGNVTRATGFLSADEADVTLSEYIDEKLRTITPVVLETENRSVLIPLIVRKGFEKSSDNKGIITAEPSISDPEIVSTKRSFETAIGSSFEMELRIEKKGDIEFYLDFYAYDDKDNNEGELSKIHCGRIKVRFNHTVLTDWYTVPAVIPKSKFIGWGHPGVKMNCYDYALEQLRQVGHWVKAERWNKRWNGEKELNDNIYQLYLEQDVAGMKKGVQRDQFEPAVEYLKKTIKSGIPVMAGVDDGDKVSNDDMTTEHFVIIVGMGGGVKGKYFLFYDNAVCDADIGASDENKLYCDNDAFTIRGIPDLRNTYCSVTTKKAYILSQVRETR